MYIILGAILVLLAVIIYRTINYKSKKFTVEPINNIKIDVQRAGENLSKVIQCKTVSTSGSLNTDWDELKKLHGVLEESYPLVHSNLEKEVIYGYSLLYRWKGKNSSKKPILLLGHTDVVPIEAGTEKDWTYPPFRGDIAEGYVWGRGALDIKIQVIAVLEAVETLLNKGYTPEQDIYLAFGHDEEVGGRDGALKIANLLKARGISFEYVLDEGGCVTEDGLKGIDSPIAVIGTCEKGYANIRLTAEDGGGHASMPPKNTALGMISDAVVKLERNQMKTKISQPVRDMFSYIGPEMKGINKVILANLWIFEPMFKKIFSGNPTGNALLRTTTAATMAQGSTEPNVLPQRASATFNFRIAPGETGEDLLHHIKTTINNPSIKIEALRLEDPSKVSSVDTDPFRLLEKTIYQIFPDALVSPYLVMAGTDARKYEEVCENIYRFSPYMISKKELAKVHATDERISLENIEKCVQFFITLIENS